MQKSLFVVVGLLGACSFPAPAVEARRQAAEPCTVAGVADPARCFTVRVRESSTSVREIDLRVIVLPAQTNTPFPDPILPLVGGHGNDGLASPDCRVSILRDFLRTADPSQLSTACATRDQALPFRLR